MELVVSMELSMVIYMATNTITGKVYIGKTVGLLGKRIGAHKCNSKKSGQYFYRSIRKHGWDAFEWSVLEYDCETEEDLNQLEYHYIQQYKRFGKGVMNLTDGGEGACGAVRSDETKQKMSVAKRAMTNETKQKIRESNFKFTYKITRPDGAIDITKSLAQYCKLNNLSKGVMCEVVSGKHKQHKGFRVEKIEDAPEPIEQPVPISRPTYDHTTPLMEVFF